jgi:hypothetical protein
MRYLFKALTGAVSTDIVPPGPGPAADTIFAFEASIDGVNFFQVGGPMEFSAPNGNIIKVDMPGCMQMRMNLIHMTGLSGPVLNVTWAVFDDNGLT